MEIKYKRSYAPKGKNYSVGEVPAMRWKLPIRVRSWKRASWRRARCA